VIWVDALIIGFCDDVDIVPKREFDGKKKPPIRISYNKMNLPALKGGEVHSACERR
jgi:hypothetical protein